MDPKISQTMGGKIRQTRSNAQRRTEKVKKVQKVNMYYVYILKSMKDGQFYTGFTDNIQKRIQKHNDGLVTATKHRTPFKLVYIEGSLNKTDALHREIYLKTAWGKRYIKTRLKNYLRENL
jgi:putative endonuclease